MMAELRNYIIKKGLEHASLDVIKQAIRQEPSLSGDMKDFWIGVIEGCSMVKDQYDLMNFLNR